ncbi:YxcD family protein [Oceanobacillus kimchii]|uniref:DUF2653 family protein n=1 Tax=Oceanobacillus kimchii TaxID=746691 RepID=A0ABQ5TNF1_9BACI|nr:MULTISPECIES: YxcD family protein [Oceanobacillus]MBT2599635.1 YxcD family protein [Oceanobacillus sp. ISL-74]MCT1576825.1 YxcD family protein [Oceanobacillus kimchii]MCT2134895.1 YxcD family protein [Oceanobacillus kimchii]OEH56182.1 hypothetical protein AQ616_01290 [Oceanobacillus sp. E9]GLO67861.1 hypothetical protein MACH08_36450 [Oceanobacillus kimchii]
MTKLIIPEEDIILAVCIYIARQRKIEPAEVEVELFYDDYSGFSAEITTVYGKQEIVTKHIISALREWIKENLHANPYAGLKLDLNRTNGIYARLRSEDE